METGLSILVPALKFFPKSQTDFSQVDPRMPEQPREPPRERLLQDGQHGKDKVGGAWV